MKQIPLNFFLHLVKLNIFFYLIIINLSKFSCQHGDASPAPNAAATPPVLTRTATVIVNDYSATPNPSATPPLPSIDDYYAHYPPAPHPTPPPTTRNATNVTANPPAMPDASASPPPTTRDAINVTANPPAMPDASATPPPTTRDAINVTANPPAMLDASATPSHRRGPKKFPIAILVGVGVIITATMVVILYCLRRKFSSNKWALWKKKTRNTQSVQMFLKNESLIPKRYKFSEIKKITNSFKDKLGQGAFGAVFKGKLDDGREVAVKVLKESKGNGEEFINEITSISRTSHVHVVTILGFCFEDSKRALIYEFMPNGSLEKFIYDRDPLQKHPHLEWETLYKIVIGIARGLEYLHRGCNTRILHFDIKPHNILLDQEFCPKISDFGLAKLCLKKESIISMTGARGTPGYIAPELINRNFGGVSHKSDVYSYGMMVLEMVGGRKNIDPRVENISEIYFPHWIYKRLDTYNDLGLHAVTTTEDEEIARKMILVGLWCIQMDPSHRPAMNKVLEMLEGCLDEVQIPPMPFFTSPSRPPLASSTATTL